MPYISEQSNLISYHAPINKYIYCYSFCLKPEELQPSGSCNFSMLDSSTLQLNYTWWINTLDTDSD